MCAYLCVCTFVYVKVYAVRAWVGACVGGWVRVCNRLFVSAYTHYTSVVLYIFYAGFILMKEICRI